MKNEFKTLEILFDIKIKMLREYKGIIFEGKTIKEKAVFLDKYKKEYDSI